MSTSPQEASNRQHPGLRLKSPARYDRLVWLFTFGRPLRLRALMLRPARLQAGEAVLDVSCGTGSLALLAKKQVGPAGRVHAIDASEEMIAYARRKAKRERQVIMFDVAAAQQLPFDDATFDVVLNTLALHHLPRASRYEALGEMRRVLRPGGRAVIEDFAGSTTRVHRMFGLLKHRHGSVPSDEIVTAMRSAGFEVSSVGTVGAKGLHFVVGEVPGGSETAPRPREGEGIAISTRGPHRAVLLFAAFAVVIAILAHVAFALSAGKAILRSMNGVEWMAMRGTVASLVILMIAAHLGLAAARWRKVLRLRNS